MGTSWCEGGETVERWNGGTVERNVKGTPNSVRCAFRVPPFIRSTGLRLQLRPRALIQRDADLPPILTLTWWLAILRVLRAVGEHRAAVGLRRDASGVRTIVVTRGGGREQSCHRYRTR